MWAKERPYHGLSCKVQKILAYFYQFFYFLARSFFRATLYELRKGYS